jgi:ferredoxin-NADP reductase
MNIPIIDSFLNKTTMYKTVLYYLAMLIVAAILFSAVGWLPYNPLAIVVSTLFIVVVCGIINEIFTRAFDAPANVESFYITALILVLLITPPTSFSDTSFFWFATWASVWACASKFMFAIKNKHIFNPAAFGVAIMAITVGLSATWWVGTGIMLPLVVIGGFMMIRKIQRWDLILSFLAMVLGMSLWSVFSRGGTNYFSTIQNLFVLTPIAFFAFAMLSEPLTTPPTRWLQIAYGAFTGFLFMPSAHILSFYFTPETALLAGNIFSYIVSPKQKLILHLAGIKKLANDTYEFVFNSDQHLSFSPGQYLEWTLAHSGPDMRGNRRYFTIASSPTEDTVKMGVKFYPEPSSFKSSLSMMRPGHLMVASQLAGDFTLPKNTKKKLVFIAGGIGITPFRSMLKYAADQKENRNIVLLYANKTPGDIAYADEFAVMQKQMFLKTIYTVTDTKSVTSDWRGRVGPIDEKVIREDIPDFAERIFYISGPRGMVASYHSMLRSMGVPAWHIKEDFFPGFA